VLYSYDSMNETQYSYKEILTRNPKVIWEEVTLRNAWQSPTCSPPARHIGVPPTSERSETIKLVYRTHSSLINSSVTGRELTKFLPDVDGLSSLIFLSQCCDAPMLQFVSKCQCDD